MSKGYIHVREDLADAAAVEVYVAANPVQYPKGNQIVAADGTLCYVDEAGSCLLVTATEPTP